MVRSLWVEFRIETGDTMRNALTSARQIVTAFVVLYIPMHALMFWIQDMAIEWKG